MTDFCTTSYPRSRKVRACVECHRDVLPGERYARVAGAVDGRPYVDVYCCACRALAVAAWSTVDGALPPDAGPPVGGLAIWIEEAEIAGELPPREQGHYYGLRFAQRERGGL
jgi:hypothetical protein